MFCLVGVFAGALTSSEEFCFVFTPLESQVMMQCGLTTKRTAVNAPWAALANRKRWALAYRTWSLLVMPLLGCGLQVTLPPAVLAIFRRSHDLTAADKRIRPI